MSPWEQIIRQSLGDAMRLPSVSDLRNAIIYDSETGIARWRAKPVLDARDSRWNGRNAGAEIRCLNTHGYIHFSFTDSFGVRYKLRLHRVVFALMNGRWPLIVDHINGKTTDNRWINLRDAGGYGGNNANRHSVKSTSGFKGVCRRDRTNNWHSQITVENKSIHLGAFDCAQAAARAYDRAAIKHFGQFAMTNAEMGLL